jgi:hypothetical protein
MFVNRNNTVFVANRESGAIVMWLNGNSSDGRSILNNVSSPYSLYVADDGEIFVNDGCRNNQVNRWTIHNSSTRWSSSMIVYDSCFSLFVSTDNQLYCSQTYLHQIFVRPLNGLWNSFEVAAGSGCPGDAPTQLHSPRGIFVSFNMSLYVADCENDRIQLFLPGQTIGVTVVGNGSSGTIMMRCPTAVALDGDGDLFIVDSNHHRIVVASSRWGDRCLVGCSGSGGSLSIELSYPTALGFDRDGNLYVLDSGNSRLQKFFLVNNSQGKCSRKVLVMFFKSYSSLLSPMHVRMYQRTLMDEKLNTQVHSKMRPRTKLSAIILAALQLETILVLRSQQLEIVRHVSSIAKFVRVASGSTMFTFFS